MNTYVLFYDDVGEIRNIYDKNSEGADQLYQIITEQLPDCKIIEVTTEKTLFEIGQGHHFEGDVLADGMHPNKIEQMRLKGILNERKYPEISEQLDLLYKDIVNGTLTAETSEFVKAIKSIKDMNPKYPS